MKNTQKKIEKGALYGAFHAATPRILACCWFFGSILIGLLVFLGITSYNGEMLDVSNCLDWIMDFAEIKNERELQQKGVKLVLSVLYILYVIRIVKQILQSLNSFRWAMKGDGDEQSRTQTVWNLNTRFGMICGMTAMHLLWACMLSSTFSPTQGRFAILTGILVFLVTGVIANYAYEQPNAPLYVLVDTLRNLLVVVIVLLLFWVMKAAPVEGLYNGVWFLVDYVDALGGSGHAFNLKELIFILYDRLCYPILHMILWIGSLKLIKQIFGDHRYFAKKKEAKKISNRFYRTCVFAAVLAAIQCVINAMCLGITMQEALPDAIDKFLPILLLCIAGTMLFRFSYPEKHSVKKEKADSAEEKEQEGEGEGEAQPLPQLPAAKEEGEREVASQLPAATTEMDVETFE